MLEEGKNPFVIYALTHYICVFIILAEMIIVMVTASWIRATADIRLSVTKYLSYPFACMISQVRTTLLNGNC